MTHKPTRGDIYKRSKPFMNYPPYYRFVGMRSNIFPGTTETYLLRHIGTGPTASPTNLNDFTFQPQSEFPELYI